MTKKRSEAAAVSVLGPNSVPSPGDQVQNTIIQDGIAVTDEVDIQEGGAVAAERAAITASQKLPRSNNLQGKKTSRPEDAGREDAHCLLSWWL